MLKDSAKKCMETVPPIIIYSFDVPRYEETSQFSDLQGCPDTVANVFLDCMEVSVKLTILIHPQKVVGRFLEKHFNM